MLLTKGRSEKLPLKTKTEQKMRECNFFFFTYFNQNNNQTNFHDNLTPLSSFFFFLLSSFKSLSVHK